jgi:hypothetical protein
MWILRTYILQYVRFISSIHKFIALSYCDHGSPLFKFLNLIKLQDLVNICTAVLMFKFHNSLLPSTFNLLFVPVDQLHNYNTRLSSNQSYSLPKPRTNYGMFNIRFQGPKIWNSIDSKIKTSSLAFLKKKLKIFIYRKLLNDSSLCTLYS